MAEAQHLAFIANIPDVSACDLDAEMDLNTNLSPAPHRESCLGAY